MSLFSDIRAALFPPPPDPKRFAPKSPPFNWHGDQVRVSAPKSGPVLVNPVTQTFEFGRTLPEIAEYLTDLDRAGLRKRNLNPDNPAYAAAKAYFSKMPFCGPEDLATNSAGIDHEGISAGTAKDVLAAFREFLEGKPTF